MTGSPTDTVVRLVQRARFLIDLRRFDDAVHELSQAVATDPHNAELWCLMAQAHLGRDDAVSALHAAEIAVSTAPAEEWAHRLASVALECCGRNEEAVASAREAVRLAPDAWEPHARLSGALTKLKGRSHRREAMSVAHRAVALGPHEPDAHLALASAAAACGRRREARPAAARALALDPNSSAAHNERARLRLKRGPIVGGPTALADAAKGFAEAVRIDPRATVSSKNLEVVLRAFVARVSYLIFLDIALVTRNTSESPGVVPRLVPLLMLAVPGVFAGRFVLRLTSSLREHLKQILLRPPLRVPVVVDALAVACLAGSAVLPQGSRVVLAAVAGIAALVARLVLELQTSQASRAARELESQPALSASLQVVVAVALALTALMLLAGAGANGFDPVIAGLAIACAAGSAWMMRAVIRRRRA